MDQIKLKIALSWRVFWGVGVACLVISCGDTLEPLIEANGDGLQATRSLSDIDTIAEAAAARCPNPTITVSAEGEGGIVSDAKDHAERRAKNEAEDNAFSNVDEDTPDECNSECEEQAPSGLDCEYRSHIVLDSGVDGNGNGIPNEADDGATVDVSGDGNDTGDHGHNWEQACLIQFDGDSNQCSDPDLLRDRRYYALASAIYMKKIKCKCGPKETMPPTLTTPSEPTISVSDHISVNTGTASSAAE